MRLVLACSAEFENLTRGTNSRFPIGGAGAMLDHRADRIKISYK
jgi:hypothetical protein